ncbi:MAG: hypothetical protein N4J56_004375 [Chroococcidiopsis sp. SAG 2025]|nr:hypothetical protein [Chroococcidiopsis sp. SAG 2025]
MAEVFSDEVLRQRVAESELVGLCKKDGAN